MNRTNLRKIFVQLLFSLAIGQVAIKCGDLVSIHASIQDYYYSYLHLFLCVMIITSSWVGWHNSKSPHNSDTVESVFSLQYVILLVDMFLVICYFIIVKGSEVGTSLKEIPRPDSYIEVFWSMVIFSTYLIWDLITKIWKFEFEYHKEKATVIRTIKMPEIFVSRIFTTFICWVCSVVIFCFMKDEQDSLNVAIIDGTLIGLFLAFRGLKQDVKTVYDNPENVHDSVKGQISKEDYPITLKDSSKLGAVKYFFMKIMPVALMIIGFFTYLILKSK